MRKKILFLSHEGSFTGAPIFLLELVKHIHSANQEYLIKLFFCNDGDLIPKAKAIGVQLYQSEKRNKRTGAFHKLVTRISHYIYFSRTLASNTPDLIYSNTMMNFGEVIISRLFGVPVILHIHEGKKFTDAFSIRLQLSCYCATRIIAGSEYAKTAISKYSRKEISVIYNGVALQAKRSKENDTQKISTRLGILGTIDANKGHHVLLAALESLSKTGMDFTLTIVGKVADEAYFDHITKLAKSDLLVNKVSFKSFVVNSCEFLKSIDILVAPSFDEVLPTVILEALSVGTLVVASQVGGIPEIIREGYNGFMFEAGNVEELATTLERIKSFSSTETNQITDAGLLTVRQKFNAEKANSSVLSIISATVL